MHVVPAWVGGERRRKKTLCKLREHYETDAGVHKLYGSFAYSWHKTLCKYRSICIMVSSCCLKCPVAAFYFIYLLTKKSVKQEIKAHWSLMKYLATVYLKQHIEKDFKEEERFSAEIIFNYTTRQPSNIKCAQDIYKQKQAEKICTNVCSNHWK